MEMDVSWRPNQNARWLASVPSEKTHRQWERTRCYSTKLQIVSLTRLLVKERVFPICATCYYDQLYLKLLITVSIICCKDMCVVWRILSGGFMQDIDKIITWWLDKEHDFTMLRKGINTMKNSSSFTLKICRGNKWFTFTLNVPLPSVLLYAVELLLCLITCYFFYFRNILDLFFSLLE